MQSCNRAQNSVLSLQSHIHLNFVFASDVLASPILLPHRLFLLGAVLFNKKILEIRNDSSLGRKLNFSVQFVVDI